MGIEFIDKYGSFLLDNPDESSYLYFPLTNESGIMGSIAPNLAGDSKIDQNSFLLEPVSNENLHTSTMCRNIWCKINGEICWSAAGNSSLQMSEKYTDKKDRVELKAGKLWHLITRKSDTYGIQADILSFSPASDDKTEIMKITFKNISSRTMKLVPTVAIPIFGRSADNLRDHRHVTSLLHRIEVKEDGVSVTPALSFDERGHRVNHLSYGVHARGEDGERPVGFYPILEDFIGEGGNLMWPKAIVTDDVPYVENKTMLEGFEAMGGIRFKETTLESEESRTYFVILNYNGEGMKYLEKEEVEKAFEETKTYWNKQSTIECHSGDKDFDQWMSWVGIQPTLRRIYGCSFLPHHDYGRGGRGWRDLWQDSLALLLMNPESIRERLISYYGGVRMDGSNATIIGTEPGEFVADRNSIVRVWMDHGLWPFITTNLYLNRTGDIPLLFENNTYFKDKVAYRGEGKDESWDGSCNKLTTDRNEIYEGSVLEHILLQHLTIFYDVGEHGHMKLRGADWNDALDMAKENGESVAFTAAYSGNLTELAKLLRTLRVRNDIKEIELAQEMEILIDQEEKIYESPKEKQRVLHTYCDSCVHQISGKRIKVKTADLEQDLMGKAEWIQKHIRKSEWIGDSIGNQWFNGYYDNDKEKVEGEFPNGARIMLTSQVFAIMSGTATDEQVALITKAVDHYLYDKNVGGYRLNTDFKELKANLGRMFGFAYGHKENGAVFSHMTVMYAYSLYSRGFVKEGFKAIKALYEQGMDFETSRIYPGIPEYFNNKGRGMYNYLTGSASWLVLTVLTEMYGVQGRNGDLILSPKLMAEQFDEEGIASVTCEFAGQSLKIIYVNKKHKEIGDYEIEEAFINDNPCHFTQEETKVGRNELEQLEAGQEHIIKVVLG